MSDTADCQQIRYARQGVFLVLLLELKKANDLLNAMGTGGNPDNRWPGMACQNT
jgi:hypothetical protein